MPSDSKKKRDLQKRAAAKQRQGQPKKPNTTNNADQNDDDFNEDNDDVESQNENENPTNGTNGTTNDVDPNVKSLIQNLDLLSMVEKANAAARSCTGVLGSHPRGRDVHIHQFSDLMKAVAALVLFLGFAAAFVPLLKQEKRVEGSYIVTFNDNLPDFATKEEVENWLTANFNGISGVTKSVYLINPTGSPRFRGFAADLTPEQLQVLQLSKDLAEIEEDSYVSVNPIYENVSSSEDAVDWGIDRVDQHCLPLNGVADPCLGRSDDCTGSNSVVWVVDTGVRYTHSEFSGRARIAANFAAGDPNPYNGDCNGHGTHCAGSVAGRTYGVAKGATIYSVRVLNCQGSGTNQNVLDGYAYVGNNMVAGKRNILSASLGGGLSTASNNAINAVAAKGVTCVVAAGNDNANACNYSPASASSVITVGAITTTNARSSFSNFGTCVNVFAPGSNIASAWYTSDTATNTISGTSMATPIVSGSFAVLSKSIGTTYSISNSQITSYATRNVVTNAGTGSPNYLVYDRWNDGTSVTC